MFVFLDPYISFFVVIFVCDIFPHNKSKDSYQKQIPL